MTEAQEIKNQIDGLKSELVKRYAMSTIGVWEVRGEDSNCDMGGSHYEPYLATYRGTLKRVIEEAVNLKGFLSWGAGGSIRKIEIQELV